MIPIQNTAMSAEAISRLTRMFRNATNVRAIVAAFASEVQELENALFDAVTSHYLANGPTGAQLDDLGALVGCARENRSDVDYLAAVKLQIRINRSQGSAEDVIEVCRLSFGKGNFTYTEEYPAAFRIRAWNIPSPKSAVHALGATREGGTFGALLHSTWATSLNFTPISTHGGSTTGLHVVQSAIGGVANPGHLVSSQEVRPL